MKKKEYSHYTLASKHGECYVLIVIEQKLAQENITPRQGREEKDLETVRHVNNRNEKAPIHTQEILFRNESCFEKCRMRIQFKFGSIYISIVR